MFWTEIQKLIEQLRKDIADQSYYSRSKKNYANKLAKGLRNKDASFCLMNIQAIYDRAFISSEKNKEFYIHFDNLNKEELPNFKISEMYIFEDVETVGKNNLKKFT